MTFRDKNLWNNDPFRIKTFRIYSPSEYRPTPKFLQAGVFSILDYNAVHSSHIETITVMCIEISTIFVLIPPYALYIIEYII